MAPGRSSPEFSLPFRLLKPLGQHVSVESLLLECGQLVVLKPRVEVSARVIQLPQHLLAEESTRGRIINLGPCMPIVAIEEPRESDLVSICQQDVSWPRPGGRLFGTGWVNACN